MQLKYIGTSRLHDLAVWVYIFQGVFEKNECVYSFTLV